MSRRISVVLPLACLAAAALFLRASPATPHPQANPRDTAPTVTAAILRLEERLDDAESHHQVASVDALIADDYTGITVGGGIITKQDVLAAVGGKEEAASSESSDRQVRAMENAAVYTALVFDRGLDPQTQTPYILASRVMDIWQKRGGKWKLVNDQATGVTLDRETH